MHKLRELPISKSSLVKLFFLSVLLIIPPIFIVNMLLIHHSHENRQQMFTHKADSISLSLSQVFSRLDAFFSKHEHTQFSCSADELGMLRQSLFSLSPAVEIGLVSNKGDMVCNSWGNIIAPKQSEVPPHHNNLRYFGPILVEYNQASSMVIAKTRPDYSEINTLIPTNWFRDLVRSAHTFDTGFVAIVDSTSAVPVFISGKYTLPLQQRLYPFTKPMTYRGLFDDGHDKFISVTPVADLPSLSIVSSINTTELYAGIRPIHPGIGALSLILILACWGLLIRMNLLQKKPERQLEIALEKQQFINHYQPIVNSTTGEIYAVEALIRWAHPTEDTIYPNSFIAEAERSDLIIPMTLQQIDRAFHELDDILERFPQMKVSFNLCNQHLTSVNFIKDIKKYAHYLDRTILELTERDVIDIESVKPLLTELKAQGAVIAIDDFGTGYSGLHHLQTLPIDVIKVDRCFVAGIEEKALNLSLLNSIIELANSVQVSVVAEGVETQRQQAHLEALNVTVHQGWLYARAMNVHNLHSWLTDHMEAATKRTNRPLPRLVSVPTYKQAS